MGLALLLAAALQAAANDPSQKIYEAKFAPLAPSERQYAQSGPAGPYFPELAFRAHQSGEAILRCTVGSNGELLRCAPVSEEPARFGFDGAARMLIARRRVTVDGVPPPGESILVRVPFTMGGTVTAMAHSAWGPKVKVSAPDVGGHAQVGCAVKDKTLGRCFVLHFQPTTRPKTADAIYAAIENETAAAIGATAQVSTTSLPDNGWVIVPVDVTPKP